VQPLIFIFIFSFTPREARGRVSHETDLPNLIRD
jgi:hypothetical protein